MKSKYFLLLSIVIIFILFCGCIGNNDPLNPLNKNIEEYKPNEQNIPDQILIFASTGNCSFAAYTVQDYLEQSDAICYATVKSVGISAWDTPDKEVPDSFQNRIDKYGIDLDSVSYTINYNADDFYAGLFT